MAGEATVRACVLRWAGYRNRGMEKGAGRPILVRVPVRVLLVDACCEFRALARELLTARGYVVVGEAASGRAALSAAVRLEPDAVVLEAQLPDASGFAVARALCRSCPAVSVLLVSTRDYGPCEELVREVGAAAFVLKSRLATAELGAYWRED